MSEKSLYEAIISYLFSIARGVDRNTPLRCRQAMQTAGHKHHHKPEELLR